MKPEQTRLNASIEDAHWWFAARRHILREVVHDLIPPSKDALVIDIGCGTGGNTGALADEYRCVGIDALPEAIEFASKLRPAARFICGQVPRDLGPLAREAKLFLMMDVIEHVPDDFAWFSSIAAEASPGALFLLTVPADPDLWSKHDEAGLHYRRYELERFQRVWEGLPFTTLMLTHYNTRLYRLVKFVRAMNMMLGRTSGDAGTDMRVPSKPVNDTLYSLFASESKVLRRALAEKRPSAFKHGVSMMAVLRREPGEIRLRTKPANVEADPFDPVAMRLTGVK